MTRKLIQIEAVGYQVYEADQPCVLGLADDGTVWACGRTGSSFTYWRQLPVFPGTDADAMAAAQTYLAGSRSSVLPAIPPNSPTKVRIDQNGYRPPTTWLGRLLARFTLGAD